MSFYMSNLGMYTIDAIRQEKRIATTRCYNSEIDLIKNLTAGQPIRFIRTDKNTKQVVDSIIVFVDSSTNLLKDSYINLQPDNKKQEAAQAVGYRLQPNFVYNDTLLSLWCYLEGWDEEFARAYIRSNSNKELWQFKYSLYPINYNYSLDNITELKDNEVFVFGSNTNSFHGLGAAKQALKFGAVYGLNGYQGKTYGLITTDLNVKQRPSIPMSLLKDEVYKFIQFAKNNTHLTFLVTEVGCGLAGFTIKQVAPLFKSVLLDKVRNVKLPKSFIREMIVSSIEIK